MPRNGIGTEYRFRWYRVVWCRLTRLLPDHCCRYFNVFIFIVYLFTSVFILLSMFLTILAEHQAHYIATLLCCCCTTATLLLHRYTANLLLYRCCAAVVVWLATTHHSLSGISQYARAISIAIHFLEEH